MEENGRFSFLKIRKVDVGKVRGRGSPHAGQQGIAYGLRGKRKSGRNRESEDAATEGKNDVRWVSYAQQADTMVTDAGSRRQRLGLESLRRRKNFARVRFDACLCRVRIGNEGFDSRFRAALGCIFLRKKRMEKCRDFRCSKGNRRRRELPSKRYRCVLAVNQRKVSNGVKRH